VSVSLVDYGLGNLGSVVNMLKRVGVASRRVSERDEILDSERVLLPGIGAFDTGMSLLHERGLVDPLREFAESGRPLFGICLGMQLLLDSSEEGNARGLGLIPGQSRRFTPDGGLRVPHMGWNSVAPTRPDSLVDGLPDDARFYFVHSYRVETQNPEHTLATSQYGVEFASMVRVGNVMGAQFHPEKSHTFGMTVLRNFALT
jgi:glutamine amidotransferase